MRNLDLRGSADSAEVPGYFGTRFGSIQVMQRAIVEKMLEIRPPDIYVRPELGGFRTLEFHRVDEIHRHAEAAKKDLKRQFSDWADCPPSRLGRGSRTTYRGLFGEMFYRARERSGIVAGSATPLTPPASPS